MKSRLNPLKRSVSFLLALAFVLTSYAFVIEPVADAANDYDTVYATPATDDELDSVSEWFTGDDTQGTYAKIVNGAVYVWGYNVVGILGLDSVGINTSLLTPTMIPRSAFDDENVVFIKMLQRGALAMTENDRIFVWGYLGQRCGFSSYTTPQEIDTTAITGNGRSIATVTHSGEVIWVRDSEGDWYVAGSSSNGGAAWGMYLLLGNAPTDKTVLQKIDDGVYETLGTSTVTGKTRTIEAVYGKKQNAVFLVTDDGMLFSFGAANVTYYQHGLGSTSTSYKTTPAAQGTTEGSRLYGLEIISASTTDVGVAVADSNGDVWGWGTNKAGRFGPLTTAATAETFIGPQPTNYYSYAGNGYILPQKIFNHNVMQKKAVRVWISTRNTVVLCEDNTVYAMGANSNGMLVPGGDTFITSMTQIFKEVSKTETIVGVYPTQSGIMALTKGGNMYFAGDNSTGAAGTGDTENAAQGTVVTVVPETLPPSEPMTANEISLEIETADGATYVPSPTTTYPNRVIKTVGTTTTTLNEGLDVKAGQDFKVNVYFNDFGKLHAFTVPLRFDPNYLQVVDSSGKAYPSTTSTPSKPTNLASSGIETYFDSNTWTGGSLAIGSADETYPKICNKDGWLSISGYSANHTANINGKQKMFSVSFTAIADTQGDMTRIEFATSGDDKTYYVSTPSPGYDEGSYAEYAYGPCWSIHNEKSTDLISVFDFNYTSDIFPTFTTTVVRLTNVHRLSITAAPRRLST